MMKRALCLAVLALAVGLPAAGQIADETAVPRISVADLKQAVDAGQALVVDVRDAGSYADGPHPRRDQRAPRRPPAETGGPEGREEDDRHLLQLDWPSTRAPVRRSTSTGSA